MRLSERLLREVRLVEEYIRELHYSSLVENLPASIGHLVHSCIKACRVGTGSKMGGTGSRRSYMFLAFLV